MTKVTNSSVNLHNHKAAPESKKWKRVMARLLPQLLVVVEGNERAMVHPQPEVESLVPGVVERRHKLHLQIPRTLHYSYDPDTFFAYLLCRFYLCFAI